MFVYVITNAVNGRVYVGKSVTPFRRWSQHKQSAKSARSPLYNAIRKYGVDAFEFAVVEECESESASYEAEARWIERLGANLRTHGYNQTAGGVGTFRPCPETRARMRKAKLGKKQDRKLVEARAAKLRGQKRSAEARANLAQADLKYRHITPAMCWEFYSQGLSCREVAKRLGVTSENPIRRLLKIGGYQLRTPGRKRDENPSDGALRTRKYQSNLRLVKSA